MRPIETIEEFSQRHGNDGLRVNGALLFSDGAMLPDVGEPIEPPSDNTERLKLRRAFLREKLRREEHNFQSLERYVKEQSDFNRRRIGPPAEEAAITKLDVMKPLINAIRAELARIESQLPATAQNRLPPRESFAAFGSRQGSAPLLVGGRYLFPNGAQSDGRSSHHEPPTDKQGVAALRYEFLLASLDAKVKSYNSEREVISAQADYHSRNCGPSPDSYFPGWRERLAAMATEIESLQAEVERRKRKLVRDDRWERHEASRMGQRLDAHSAIATLTQLPNF